MASVVLMKRVAQVALNNGTDSQGNIKTVNMSIGSLTTGDGYTDDKVLNIATALAPCLSKTLNSVRRVDTNTIARQ